MNPSVPAFVSDALQYSIENTRRNLSLTHFPEMAKNGAWSEAPNGGWVGGHWTGLLWLSFAHSGDPIFEAAARQWSERLLPRKDDTTTHDLGFLFQLSYLLGSMLTGDAGLKEPVLTASRTLTRRFNQKGLFFQAWRGLDAAPEWRGRAIVDTMMNLYMLFWASRETGDPLFAQEANAHALTVLKHQVRPDWSTAHVIDFNPDTGEFLKQDTHQGLSPTSCWTRGHAWAIHGFAECFRWTGNPVFLDASRNLANYFLRRLPADNVPFWDFDSSLIPNDVRDSSAGSIAASGMLILETLEKDPAQAKRWHNQALTILESLWVNYSSRGVNEPSILIHATRSKPAGTMDHGLIYGDYYFLEALTRLAAPEKLPF